MTVAQLIEQLQDLGEEMLEAEVRIAIQPSWPLQYNVGSRLVTSADLATRQSDEDEDEDTDIDEEKLIVWITEGSSCDDSPYAPDGVFNER